MSNLLTTMMGRVSSVWKAAPGNLWHGWQWLTRARDPINWGTVRGKVVWWLRPKSIASRALAIVVLVAALVGIIPWLWKTYSANLSAIIPLGAGIGGALVAWAALAQAATARRRHEAQTQADLQRRITESFGKATEQLGSDKIEVRLGGIYTLERVSLESRRDHLRIMETLTAFVRERARWKKLDPVGPEEGEQTVAPQQPPTDIAAVLAVIVRRLAHREQGADWQLDLSRTDLGGAVLDEARLVGANFWGAHLEGADLARAHLESAILTGAHLESAYLGRAHLERANLQSAHLEGANLRGAHLDGADLRRANLSRADLHEANLCKSRLMQANLNKANLSSPLTKSMGASFEQQKNPTGRRCDSFVRREAQARFHVASRGTTGILSTGC
jgi:uncharacterized protein YjbI with pentapeptide repeats